MDDEKDVDEEEDDADRRFRRSGREGREDESVVVSDESGDRGDAMMAELRLLEDMVVDAVVEGGDELYREQEACDANASLISYTSTS